MAYKGKFIDRNPHIPFAGLILQSVDTVDDSLRVYSHEEEATNIINRRRLNETAIHGVKSKLCSSQENLKDILRPELEKSSFVEFREKFSENMFIRKPELGKVLPLQTKPESFTNENFTYGLKQPQAESSYEFIFPKKTKDEIYREYMKWHDKYVISHNHYFPSERIRRHYNDKFNPNSTFGICRQVDMTGHMVRQCLQQKCPLVVVTKAHKKFINRTVGLLGGTINCSDQISEQTQWFGHKSKHGNCDVRALIENIEPSPEKNILSESVAYVNKLRRRLFNNTDFQLHDLKIQLKKYDDASTGFVSVSSIFKALSDLLITVDKEKIIRAMSHFKILIDEGQPKERVNADLFWKMLHIQYPLPCMGNLSNMPKNFYNKDTTYRTFCSDREKPSKSMHVNLDDDRTEETVAKNAISTTLGEKVKV